MLIHKEDDILGPENLTYGGTQVPLKCVQV